MIGFIGGGNMAEAMIKGMLKSNIKDIMVSEPRSDRLLYLKNTYNIKTTPDNKELVRNCNILIIAVKPQNIEEVTAEISNLISKNHIIISIAAGVPLSYLTSKLKTSRIIRVMPNTPAVVQEGVSVLSMCECIHDREIGIVKEIFMSIGRVLILPEKYMDAVTALSGSGPAFFALFVEHMIQGGIEIGLSKDTSSELAIQTFIGTAKLLESGISPEKIRIMVTSPGGTTEAGLKVFEERGFKDLVLKVLLAAKKRSEDLGKKF